MVYKGIIDENGVVHPVQGAGTTYNEELNSIALGSGTSAIGENQFVFGRSNNEDPNKVEIVGGGTFIDVPILDITSALIVGENDLYTEYYIGGGFDAINNFLLSKQARLEVEELPLDYTISDIWLYNMRVYDRYIHGHGLVMKDGVTLSGTKISYPTWGSDNIRYENDVTVFHQFNVGEKIEKINSLVPRSIRTLDWEGNQWNAGDLTCDDGEGGIISVRELATRINNSADKWHTHEIDDVTNLRAELDSKMDVLKEIYLSCDSITWEVTPTGEGEVAFEEALVFNTTTPRIVIVNIHKYNEEDGSSRYYRTIGSIYCISTQTNTDSYDLEAFIMVDGRIFKRTGQENYQEMTWAQGLTLETTGIFD